MIKKLKNNIFTFNIIFLLFFINAKINNLVKNLIIFKKFIF